MSPSSSDNMESMESTRAECPLCTFDEDYVYVDKTKLFYCRTCNVVVWLDADSGLVVHIMEPEIPVAKDFQFFLQAGLFWISSKSQESVSFIEARTGKEILFHSGTGWRRTSNHCPQLAASVDYQNLEVKVTAGHIHLTFKYGNKIFTKYCDRKSGKVTWFQGRKSLDMLTQTKKEICIPSPQHHSTSKKETNVISNEEEFETVRDELRTAIDGLIASLSKKRRIALPSEENLRREA